MQLNLLNKTKNLELSGKIYKKNCKNCLLNFINDGQNYELILSYPIFYKCCSGLSLFILSKH